MTHSLIDRVLLSGKTSSVDAFMRILAGVCKGDQIQVQVQDEKTKKDISILCSLYQDILTLMRRYIHKEEIVLNGLTYLYMISSIEFPQQFDFQIFELGDSLVTVKTRARLLHILGGFCYFKQKMLPYLSHVLDLLQKYLSTPEKEYFYLNGAYLLSNLLSESPEVTNVVLYIDNHFFVHFLENCLHSTSYPIVMESLILFYKCCWKWNQRRNCTYIKLHIESLCSNEKLEIRDEAHYCLLKFNQLLLSNNK